VRRPVAPAVEDGGVVHDADARWARALQILLDAAGENDEDGGKAEDDGGGALS
jgi:hypothetical protein